MRISDWSSDVCSSDLICAIPLVSATLAVDRKTLLMALLIGFAVSNIVVAVSSSYEVIVASRILGGICAGVMRSEEHTSELQSLMRISYAVFCLKKKNTRILTVHLNTYSDASHSNPMK